MSDARRIEFYDTTLRDGTQGEGVSLSVLDKMMIAQKLDAAGFDYIEGGYPLSNPKDVEFFQLAQRDLPQHNAALVSFGMTRRKGIAAADDVGLNALRDSGTPIACVVGKSWDLHLREVLDVDEDEGVAMIAESVAFLRQGSQRVFYDAEHFFDGYRANPTLALRTLKAARDAGAECIILCDTNGGSLPSWIGEVTRTVINELGATGDLPAPGDHTTPGPLRVGIHTHNDGGLAVANTLAAIEAGACHVQGTINGLGERCGNADLLTVAANLRLKLGMDCLADDALAAFVDLSRFVDETANLVPRNNQPYVGRSAFAHKGGMHVHAINKVVASYEHVPPESVGNSRRVLISELGGGSNIGAKVARLGITDRDTLRKIQATVNDLEAAGYSFEAADASFELLVRECLGERVTFWSLDHFRCEVASYLGDEPISEATVKLSVDGDYQHTVAEGTGPVDAIAEALRKALRDGYPAVDLVRLVDYKVRVVDGKDATRARVRVEIEWQDHELGRVFTTIGVSPNIIDASYQALRDGLEYKLLTTRPNVSLA